MIKYLILLMLICPLAFAQPTSSDTTVANKLMDTLENSQTGYKNTNGRYEQIFPKMGGNKILFWTDEYKSECGLGYIANAEKVIDEKVWRIQRHVGCEERIIYTEWTQLYKGD